jgi:hypothetical protein
MTFVLSCSQNFTAFFRKLVRAAGRQPHRAVDLRIIAATNQDLWRMVRSGSSAPISSAGLISFDRAVTCERNAWRSNP